ncbi:intermembrane phospholipid transport protein YdbH family protein [Rhodovibrio salinarum]|uniref:Dicarboxylate transport n=1 Tax=Rhodovibrio salinarum TaxID=1087 RepID=A0A934V104_9PROT|nr:YdbH domain-containing protein [Rhodovibrio salinarum]MBK1698035.1 hypothetical protein [Rhodovibrio salinarum]
MRRWLLWLPLSVVTLLVVLAAGLLLARAEVAEAVARQLLAQRGFPNAELTVATLTTERLELTDIDLGPGAPKAARIAVAFTPASLIDGRIGRIEIDGPRVTVDLTAEQPMGGVLGLVSNGKSAETGPSTTPRVPDGLPTVLLRNAAVDVRGARSVVQLSLAGRIGRRDGEMRGTLRGRARTPHTTADLSLDARQLQLDPHVFLKVTGKSALARLPWPDDVPHRPTAGHADFALTGELQFPTPGSALTLQNLIRPSSRLNLELSVADLDLPDLATGVQAGTTLHLAASDGSLVVRLLDPLKVQADTLEGDRLAALGLPADAAAQVGEFRQLTLSPWSGGHELVELHAIQEMAADDTAVWRWNGRASVQAGSGAEDGNTPELRVRAAANGTLDRGFGLQVARVDLLDAQGRDLAYGPHRLDAFAFNGQATIKPGGLTLDGTLDADGLSVAQSGRRINDMRLTAPLAVRATLAGTRVGLSAPATLTIPELPDTSPVKVDTPVTLTFTDLQATAASGRLQAQVKADPGTLNATLLRQEADNLRTSLTPGPLDLALESLQPLKARIAFDGGRLTVPDLQIQAREVSAEFKQSYGNPVALITLGHLTHDATPAVLKPSLLWMQLHATDDQGWRVVGQQIVKGTDITLPFSARTDADARNGEATIGPFNASFVPGGVQPGRISPWLGAQVRNVEGEFGVRGALSWTPAGLTDTATVALTDLSFTTAVATVAGLSGTVFFDSLTPTDTSANQRLTADSVTAGVPLEGVEILFDVDSEEGDPVIHLARADGTLAEGEVFVRDATLRPWGDDNRLNVQVRDLSMSQLVGLLEVDGLSAEGTLAGDIPLHWGPDGFQIEQGKLAAVDTGRIRVTFGAAQDALASQGESVQLMVRALKDFRYDLLSLTVTQPAGGNPVLGITMQGRNPDVLDGYPFKFNINLTGDLNPILQALQKGQTLTTDLLQRALENRGAETIEIQ